MKIERMLSMIYTLLNHEVISASELAEKYQVSQRTIYRDIDTICATGIPVVSYHGVNGGYGIMDTYKLDKNLLSTYDVETLLAMLGSLSNVFADEQTSDTLRKLQTIRGDGTENDIIFDFESRWIAKHSLRLIKSAIKSHKVISMEYINLKGERMVRNVEPVCLMYRNHTWYLYGYCRFREAYREFRLSRMANLQAFPETFHQQHAMPAQMREKYSRPEPATTPVEVRVRFSSSSLALALDFFPDSEKMNHVDGSITLIFKLNSQDESKWLIPMIASFGEDAEIEEPGEWRTKIKTMLEHMLTKYKDA
ncbi:YafY family protein [Halalkalibacter sp. APA_J-10(15)]|uniref:helix-turn-helix transcriptional regulator n=1 Tax=Halalkalibacter sp. APA_J-10(15) TaxID=2933805 RepID=UPI001FF67007|nr:YafY family protein [Halalkalibacter sp. APA_J-10(15)]MCK0473827.1 YafY family transcriptional regulator [Halalkalibacter sp. APA_J-10(15)]